MSKFVPLIEGAALIGTGLFLEFVTFGVSTPLTVALISAGAGMVLTGIGTLLSQGPVGGSATATRDPIAPWNVVVGRRKLGGTCVYVAEFGNNDKYLDLVLVLACHPCASVDELLFDGQRVQLDGNGAIGGSTGGTSFTPVQQTINIFHISRTNNVVTVVLTTHNIPYLQDGDVLTIQGITGDLTLNGRFPVTIVSQTTASPGTLTFSYLCGGMATTVDNEGQVVTEWPDYGSHVFMEVLLGNHTATFPGMLIGTPNPGDPNNPEDLIQYPGNNPWSAACLLLGRTSVHLRLNYDATVFANGLPTISFVVHGKCDIVDPRTDPPTIGYTENPALIIADHLCNTVWGFKATLGTDVPIPQLIAAANICDEPVALAAGGTEPRYTCNGGFPLTMKRGEVLQNLLTSCGGRLTDSQGQLVIWPAAWGGVSLLGSSVIGDYQIVSATLYVVSTFTKAVDGPDGGQGAAAFYLGAIGIEDGSTAWLNETTQWTEPRTDTQPIDSTLLNALLAGTLNANFDIEGSIFGTNECHLNILAVWIQAIFADGSTGPIGTTISNPIPGSTGSVLPTGGQWTFDGVTFPVCGAEINRTQFTPLGTGPIGQIGGWFRYQDISPSPSSSPVSIAQTAVSLALASGPFKWRPKLAIRDLYNGCKGTFVSPTNKWQPSDFPPYAQDTLHGYASGSPLDPFGDANLAADGGDRRWFDIQLPFTISVSMAQRLAKIELMRRRQQGTGTFLYNMAIYEITALDIIEMTMPLLGWASKLLEVAVHRFTLSKVPGGATLLGTEIDVQETDPSVYEWSSSEELSAYGYQQATVPSNVGDLDSVITVNGV